MNLLIRPLLVIFASLTVVTGLAYPAAMTAVGQVAFSDASNGSILTDEHGKPAGSRLIGQQFDAPKYIWGRLSATSPMPYNGQGSSGSNLGPTNPALADAVKARIAALQAAGTDTREPVPVDLVTASASGLDPEISPAAALYQAARVANARKIPRATVEALIDRYTSGRQFGILGEPRVNVLQLNLALDAAQPRT